MKILSALHKPFAVISKITLTTALIIGLSLIIQHTYSLSLLHEAKALPSFVERKLLATEPLDIDTKINVLSPNDAARYRKVFILQEQRDWDNADAVISTINDKILLGHVLADRYLKGFGDPKDLQTWLRLYTDFPEAESVYSLAARKFSAKERKKLTKPGINTNFSRKNFSDEQWFSYEIPLEKFLEDKWNKAGKELNLKIRQDKPAEAEKQLLHLINSEKVPADFLAIANAVIAAEYFYLGERDKAEDFGKKAADAGEPLGLWILGLIAWSKKDYPLASVSFVKAAEDIRTPYAAKAAANFWAYRALVKEKKSKEGYERLGIAARFSESFYGALAWQLLKKFGREEKTAETKENTKETGKNNICGQEARRILVSQNIGKRALALLQVGQKALAEKELRKIYLRSGKTEQDAVKTLAREMNLSELNTFVETVDEKRKLFADDKHYQVPNWQPKNGFFIDPLFIYALAHHESGFDPEATSKRGAKGIMQIMPATAIAVEGGEGQIHDKLSDPEQNMDIGQKYVRYLANQKQIKDNLLLLLAAYNSGPSKVMRWVENRQMDSSGKEEVTDPLFFIETIPQKETRKHIRMVLLHYWKYKNIHGDSVPVMLNLAEGKWPRLPLATREAETTLKGKENEKDRRNKIQMASN